MSAPYKPMLAKPMSAKGIVTNWSDWAVQEKYDGHRLIIERRKSAPLVVAWSRPRGDDEAMAERSLPAHLVMDLCRLPVGVYDGELLVDLKDATGTDVTRTDLEHKRYVVLFDVLELEGVKQLNTPFMKRVVVLNNIGHRYLNRRMSVQVAPTALVESQDDVKLFVEAVWKRGGEGAILKRRDGVYEAGIRSKNCVKVKRVSHATLTIIGFEKSKGTVRFPGHPFAIVKLRDDDGNQTTVKAKNDYELNRLSMKDIGRKLVIEFPKRTRTGGYQGPVLWDRWADAEGE
jgi:ATP-dependent DNA ligase